MPAFEINFPAQLGDQLARSIGGYDLDPNDVTNAIEEMNWAGIMVAQRTELLRTK